MGKNTFIVAVFAGAVSFFSLMPIIVHPASFQRLVNVQGGDCVVCHEADGNIPPDHVETKAMNLGQCLECHSEDNPKLVHTLPLSHSHLLSGVTCVNCHGKTDPAGAVGSEQCMACHKPEQLPEKTKGNKEANPHNSHYGPEMDCDLCHHVHAPSANYCNQCHEFTFIVPSPMAGTLTSPR